MHAFQRGQDKWLFFYFIFPSLYYQFGHFSIFIARANMKKLLHEFGDEFRCFACLCVRMRNRWKVKLSSRVPWEISCFSVLFPLHHTSAETVFTTGNKNITKLLLTYTTSRAACASPSPSSFSFQFHSKISQIIYHCHTVLSRISYSLSSFIRLLFAQHKNETF